MVDIFQAIDERVSCRAYADRRVEPEKLAQIEQRIREINKREGLHFQLCGPHGGQDVAVKMSESMFVGPVYRCIACIAPTGLIAREKLGYFGEELVLLATQLGLGTCWVASTYDRESVVYKVAPGEEMACIITLGYAAEKTPLKQRTIRAGLRAKDKKLEKLMAGNVSEAPAWFADAVECARKAPTAVNLQPVVFSWQDGVASADMPKQTRAIQDVDLGICKLHFALGSRQQGTWEWGRGATFRM